MRRDGFTLIEMLVVIGILAILMGASIAGYARVTRSAERAKAQELVSNVATALAVIYQKDGVWPPKLLNGAQGGCGRLDADVARALVSRDVIGLSNNGKKGADMKLTGLDKCGVVTPWATTALKRAGREASTSTRVGDGGSTVQDHIFYYALDLDGDGVVRSANVGGVNIDVRAQAIVWCCGRDGKLAAYRKGGGKTKGGGNIYSWQVGQTEDVQ